MTAWKTSLTVLAASAVLILSAVAADDKPTDAVLTIVDAAGKEHKVKAWTFVLGTRKLGWLAPEPPADAPPPTRPTAPVGPEAFVFRDDNSTNFVNGILTLIPVESLRAVEFDAEMQTATVKVAITGESGEESQTGTTKYRDNKLTLEAEVDKGDLGIAEVKFLGGVKGGVQAFRFGAAKPVAAVPAGRSATVSVLEKGAKKNEQKVTDLRPLYQFADGSQKLLPTLMFKKTLKIDVNKLQKLAKKGEAEDGIEWGVTLEGGEEETYTLLTKPMIDGKAATLEGLVARVPIGWKLYPVHTISEVQFEK